jgi:hypothetical protein
MTEMPPVEVMEVSKKKPTYFVFYQPCSVCPNKGVAPTAWPVTEVMKIKKVAHETYLTIYQVESR